MPAQPPTRPSVRWMSYARGLKLRAVTSPTLDWAKLLGLRLREARLAVAALKLGKSDWNEA